jgi:hypothetical protein
MKLNSCKFRDILFAGTLLTLGLSLGCAPKFYIVDRQTVLEDEAAGEWPQFEKEIVAKSSAQGPTAFQKPDETEKKRRLFNVLNGEMVSKSSDSKKK